MAKRSSRRFFAFARSSAGSAVVEYAVCIALIVGTILAVGMFIGTPLKNTFLGTVAIQQATAGPTNHNAAISSAKAPVAEASPYPSSPWAVWLPICIAGIVPAIATLWLVRRNMVRAKTSEAPEPAPVPKDLQARFVVKRQAILHFLSAESQQLAHGKMTVRQVMSTSVLTRKPTDSVHELRQLMKESVIRHLLVCATGGKLVGIVSDRDIQGEGGDTVADIMTANPITVTPDMPVAAATTILLAKRINCVPVVEDGKLIGIVTTSDLLMALQCVLRLIEQLSLPAEGAVDLTTVECT
ncbi:MAG TPA: CBS domain-containing protein [Pirellulales bacterium]|jgi:CBS domain-containing protein/Flp pilus assembly pilin Flp|nr:CBS domain-containing protein [Pirellulales bacterium]